MNAIFHSLLISAAIVLLWYLWEKFRANIINESMGVLSIIFGEESPEIINFILPWLGVAVLHYFVATFWFWWIIGIVTLLFSARLFRETIVWWVVMLSLIGAAIWHMHTAKAEPPSETSTEKVAVSDTTDSQTPTNHGIGNDDNLTLQSLPLSSNTTERTTQP